MATKEVQKKMLTLSNQLDDVPEKMRIFSLSMRSLFTENAVGTSSSTAQKFRKLRDDTRNDAVVYVTGVLPVVKQCVSDIKGYFEYYIDLTMEEWWDSIADIIEETKAHKEACDALIVIHQDIITELKKREDVAKVLMTEMKDLSAEYEKKAAELRQSAEAKNAWAIGLAFVPFVNVIATPILGACAKSDLADAVAKAKEANIQVVATAVVRDTLVPALSQFIEGLQDIAGFFEVLHQELETFHSKGEKAKDAGEPKRMHYNTMKGKADRIMGGCNGFFAALPAVRSDLEAIPTEGTDQNYVDKWLENQKAVIVKKCSNSSFVKRMVKAIQGGSK